MIHEAVRPFFSINLLYEIIKKLENIEQKIDFNYNVLNKHLVRIMAYGVKVKEGEIDKVRNSVDCN